MKRSHLLSLSIVIGLLATTVSADPQAVELRKELASRQPDQSIVVQVRYPTKYGYAGRGGAFRGNDPNSCDQFSVQPSVASDPRPTTLISISLPQTMRQAGGMYVCEYLIDALPFDKPIVVGVTMRNPRDPSTQAWIEGSEAQPPQGQQRLIVDGRRHLQLTANAPRAALVFEMVYAPLGLTELPLQQPSPLLRVLPRVEAMQETYRIRAADRAQEVELLTTPPQP